MAGWGEWLDERIGALRAGRRVLVLCRTRASLSLVRRWAARRGGVLGLEAATPSGLAQQVLQDRILDQPRAHRWEEDELPPATAIGQRVGARPGLVGVARRWVQHVRLARRVGLPIVAPEWLDELVDTGFGVDDGAVALEGLLGLVEKHGRRLSASASWDRVVAVGFDREPEALAPHEPWLLDRLVTRRAPAAPEPAPGPIPARWAPDVAAEARLAVRLAAQDHENTLILVNDLATARRVRDALLRSGLPCAWRDSEALAVHELASAVRRCAPWFADAPDPPIPVADLGFVLSRTALGRKLHPAAEAAIVALLAPTGAEPARLVPRTVKQVLEGARLLDGPLSAWRARVREQLADPKRAGAAAAVLVRLELLNAALSARPVDEVLAEATGAELAFDADDFDDVVATLLGDDWQGASLPDGRKLGAVQRFLLACRVRLHEDPVARAIVGALRDRSEWPVSPSHVHHALAGAIDLGVMSDGVDVITVEDYDDRPCGRLIVLDVHDHGIARRPNPDPLLDDEEIGSLGALSGLAQVEARLAQVHRAVARAGEAVAIVTRRDASGREVVPPIQLDLRFDEVSRGEDPLGDGVERIPSYGWRLLALPESEPRLLAAETVGRTAPPPGPARHPDPVVRLLADQATAEWYRDGRGPPTFGPAEVGNGSTLAELLRAEVPLAPAHLLPYLGHAEIPEAVLPDGPHSVTRLLTPLAHCGYQAFARRVLGIEAQEPIADDLDPAEVGTAVHEALEIVTPETRWRGADVPMEVLVDRLREATRTAFARAVEPLGLSLARRASADGHRDRWNEHWPLYVRSRALPPANAGPGKMLEGHPVVPEWVRRIRDQVPAARDWPEWKIRGWVLWAAKMAPADLLGMHESLFLREDDRESMPRTALPDLQNLVGSPEWHDLHRWTLEMAARMAAWSEVPHATAAEVPFGYDLAAGDDHAPPPPATVGGDVPEGTTLALGPTVLRLGEADVALRGRIDRLDFVRGPRGEPLVGVVDYKTGKAREGWQFRRDQLTLRDPQLLVYAMVIERASREDRLPEALGRPQVVAVAHDRVRQAVSDPESAGHEPRASDTWQPIDRRLLGWAAGQLGFLLDEARRGRWSLRPRADTCPMLSQYGNDRCPVAHACRFRALPDPGRDGDGSTTPPGEAGASSGAAAAEPSPTGRNGS